MTTERIETRLDETTVKQLDDWRMLVKPQLSRSEAVRILLEERLSSGQHIEIDHANRKQENFPDANRLGAIYTLERINGFGPVKFRAIHDAGVDPQAVIENPDLLPFTGRTGEKLRRDMTSLSLEDVTAGRNRAADQIERAKKFAASILTHGDPDYPERVYTSNNPVPVLYVRGDPEIWKDTGSVAVVGSRNTRDPYTSDARHFVRLAVAKRKIVISGFAIGADATGHVAALEFGGSTVCVMPCGLDNVFPPENRALWEKLLSHPDAVFVSEFGFGQRASSLLLRKRNKLIVAFAQGVLVAQSAVDGGAMNAYRFGREQRKPVATFRPDGSEETSGNAVIEKDDRTGGLAFEMATNPSISEEWLQKLSSLI